MSLTPQDIALIMDWRNTATQQANSGVYSPLTIQAANNFILPETRALGTENGSWYDYRQNMPMAESGTSLADYETATAADWANHDNFSALSYDQYKAMSAAVPENGFLDSMGRMIVPGTTINVDGGSYVYDPTDLSGNASINSFGIIPSELSPTELKQYLPVSSIGWHWQSPTGAPDPMIAEAALQRSGVIPKVGWIGTTGGQGFNFALSAALSGVGGMYGAINGAASSLGGTLTNYATDALTNLGINEGIANGLSNVAYGAGKGYLMSGGDPNAALMGGISAGTTNAVNQGLSGLGNMLDSGGNMYLDSASNFNLDNVDLSFDSSLPGGASYDYFNLDPATLDYSYTPSIDSGLSSSGSGDWSSTIDWGKLATVLTPAALAGVTSAIGGKTGSGAAGQAAATQQASADKALQLQRDMWEYQKTLNAPFYDKGLKGFDQYASAVTGQPGTNGKVWTPTESPAYLWQQEQANKNNSRTLRALGRENSSYGMGEQFKTQQNLAATEYDKQLGRLADLTNIARGGASALTGASTGYSTNAANNITTSGNNQANAQLAGGMLQQNNLYNGINSTLSGLNLGLKAWNS